MTMDEKELNEAICNIMFWYKDTPMAIPQKIVELIIKDRKRICEPLVSPVNEFLEANKSKGPVENVQLAFKCCVHMAHGILETLTLAGLDKGERL